MASQDSRPSRDLRLSTLEDRVLFDAVPIAEAIYAESVEDPACLVDSAECVESRTEVVFIDAGVDDVDALLSEMDRSANLEFHFLDGDTDGLQQIANYLDGRSDISALHIVSHGDQAELLSLSN